jgi:hypothetical protein
MYRHFQRRQAFENEGIGKSHFSIPFQKRPMDGRFWMLTSQLHYPLLNPAQRWADKNLISPEN